MDLFQALILGIVQGITEWLPVSSSGHLMLAQEILKVGPDVAFDVTLHLATLLVIFIVFWKDILEIIRSVFAWRWDEHTKMLVFIILATIPTGIIGILFQDFLLGLFANMVLLGVFFIVNGVMLLLTKLAKPEKDLNWWKSIVIGISQGASIIPSISRSGATISTGMILGVKKEKLVTFSFLMAIPAILGAFVFEMKDIVVKDIFPMLAGSLAALIVGYFALKALIKLVKDDKLHYFAWYCILIGIAILLFL